MSYDSEVLADVPQCYCKLYTSESDSSSFGRSVTVVGTVGTHVKYNQTGAIATDSASRSTLLTDVTGLAFNNTSTTGAMGYFKVASPSPWGYTHDKDYFSQEIWYRAPAGVTGAWTAQNFPLTSRRKSAPIQWQLTPSGSTMWNVHPGIPNSQYSFNSSPIIDPAHTESLFAGSDYESAFNPAALPSIKFAYSYDGLAHMHTMTFSAGALWHYYDGIKAPSVWNAGIGARGSNTSDPYIVAGSFTDTQANGMFGYYSNSSFYNVALSQARVLKHYQAAVGTVVYLNTQWSFSGAKGMTLAAAASFAAGFDQLRSASLICAASVNVASAMSQNQRLGVAFMDDVSIASSVATSPLLQWVLANTVNINAALGFNSIQQFDLYDCVLAGVAIQAGEAVFDGWIINPRLAASVMTEGFGFNSFAQFKGQYYAARDSGIYLLGGDTDDGAPILSYVSLPKTTFGTAKMKRIPFAYIGAASDGTMVLRVVADGQQYDYAVRNPTTDMAEQRVDLGRGLKSNYWQFELINRDGADFSLDTIKFMPVILERRI